MTVGGGAATPQGLARVLADGAARHGDRVAVIDPALEREVTYAGLLALVERAARRLVRVGLGDGDVVAVLARNGLEQAVAVLACSRAGLVHLGLPVEDPADRLGAVLGAAGARVLLVQPSLADTGDALLPGPEGAGHIDLGVRSTGLLLDEDPAEDLLGAEGPAEGAVEGPAQDGGGALGPLPAGTDRTYALICTSGSTGRPKLVRLTGTMTDTAARTYTALLGLGPADRTAVHLPMWWVSGHVTQLASALHSGGAVVTMANWSPAELLRVISRHGVTWLDLVPTLWHGLLREAGFTGEHLPTLRTAVFGGAPASPEVLAAVRERLPGLGLFDAYAMSEVPAPITCLTADDSVRRAGTVGRALPHVELRVVDPAGEDVPTGQPGAVAVRTVALSPGYAGPAGAEVPLADPDGWFRTGDLGTLDPNGYLRITGRAADVLLRGGVAIHPGEVERALVSSGLVEAALVVGMPSLRHGDDVAALVVPSRTDHEPDRGDHEPDRADLDVGGLRAAVRQRVGLHAVPVRVLAVTELPRNGNGKPDRQVARDLLRLRRP